MMTYIIMVVILVVVGCLSYFLINTQLEKYYKNPSEEEQKTKERPSQKKIIIYTVISTLLNIGIMALSYFFYQDRALYAMKLSLILQWIIIVAFIDHYCYVIPNSLVLVAMGMGVAFGAVEILYAGYPAALTLKDYGFGFLLGAGVFLISAVFVSGGIGMGDIKMYGALGLLLGCVGVFNLLFYSILISAICGIGVLLFKKGNKKTTLPMGPFTYAGMVFIMIMGI